MRAAIGVAAAPAAALAAWSLYEAQWLETRELEIPIDGLPAAFDGFRILHLSDFHLGTLSLNAWTLERAVRWAEGREADLVAITGDLLSRRGGRAKLDEAVRRLAAPHGVYAVLGNHDIDQSRDPFAEATDVSDLDRRHVALLGDSERSFSVRGSTVQVVGVDPDSYRRGTSRPAERADSSADLRILLCHFPEVVDRLPAGSFHLVLAGHLHGGQICLPRPGGRIRLEHLRADYWEGLFVRPGGVLHVSRGIGTSFVPFRLLARPDATVLVLTPK